MKTVTYYDATFEVPDWTNYVVAEADGSVWAYEIRPEQPYLESNGDVEWLTSNISSKFIYLIDVEFSASDGKTYKPMKV